MLEIHVRRACRTESKSPEGKRGYGLSGIAFVSAYQLDVVLSPVGSDFFLLLSVASEIIDVVRHG